jgi:hypothetical protein
MRFTKIAVKKDTVELAWTKVDEHGATITTTMTSPEKPAPELPDALQAFKDFVFNLIDAPDAWREGTRVTTLSLNEEKEGNGRGLIVSAVKPVAKASGRVLVLNTPHMRQGGDNTTSQTGILDDATIDLIAAAEKAATAFVKGDRMQGELLPADAAKTATGTDDKPVDQVSARRKKKDKAAGTPGEVMNPGRRFRWTTPSFAPRCCRSTVTFRSTRSRPGRRRNATGSSGSSKRRSPFATGRAPSTSTK